MLCDVCECLSHRNSFNKKKQTGIFVSVKVKKKAEL